VHRASCIVHRASCIGFGFGFAVYGPLTLLGNACHAVLVLRLTIDVPRFLALMQLRFISFVVINSRRDLLPQVCAQVGHVEK
jgi:hypothetical protein